MCQMEIILRDGIKYLQHIFASEEELEKVALEHSSAIFGKNALVFTKKTIQNIHGIKTIPDAFVILPDLNKWFVVEVERACHPVHNHILPQITKFMEALNNGEVTKSKLLKFFDDGIDSDFYKKATWKSATGDHHNIHRQLSNILNSNGQPEIVIIIDKKSPALSTALSTLNIKAKITVFKQYAREGVGVVDSLFQFDTLDIQNAIVTKPTSAQTTSVTKPTSLTSSASNTAQNRTVTNHTPSALDWSLSIHELAQVNGLTQWSKICNHLGVKFEGDSARRALARWVKVEKPNWPPVP